MSKKGCSKIIVQVFGILLLVAYASSNCPSNKLCHCTPEYINCTCPLRKPMIFREIDDSEEPFSGKQLIISGCERIEIKKAALAKIDVEDVVLSDLLELSIEVYAFNEAKIKSFHISDIEKLHLESYAFASIENVTDFVIRNVTAELFERSLFFQTTVSHFDIRDSNIQTLKTQSLHLNNSHTVTIQNNNIGFIDVDAIEVTNSEKFSFTNNSVNHTSFGSLSLFSDKEVEFGYCHFLNMTSNAIITKSVDLFRFHNNYIAYCEKNAFWGIQVNKELDFVENKILESKQDSLIPNFGPHQSASIISQNNEISCSCTIDWLLIQNVPKYDPFKERNACYQPQHLKGVNLSLLTMTLDKDSNCASVDVLTPKISPIITIPTTTETEKTNDITLHPNNATEVTSSTDEEATEDLPASRQSKRRSKHNSGSTCQCSTILSFILLAILIL